jgi:hypothetical protein
MTRLILVCMGLWMVYKCGLKGLCGEAHRFHAAV